ncbi:MAG: nucleotidyltransferase domain-containing protein [Actinomycetota bacterium]|nr:nucleotidyltransferase domain-containing protein [Actinomycetota bacterium]
MSVGPSGDDSDRRPTLTRNLISAIRQIGAAPKGRELRLFGSVAEGTDTVDSDLDVLVTFDPDASLFDVAALGEELEELLGVLVDIVSAGGLKERDQHIRATAIPV